MASRQQLTGMRGVYLVAAELSRLGFIASPTSRSAIGADILATDQTCRRAFSVQVKTNASKGNFWLLSKKTQEMVSKSHIYVLVYVNINGGQELIEYYVVPSKVVAAKMVRAEREKTVWHSISRKAVLKYRDKWSVFGVPESPEG
jgi:hypothetical protein